MSLEDVDDCFARMLFEVGYSECPADTFEKLLGPAIEVARSNAIGRAFLSDRLQTIWSDETKDQGEQN